MNKKKILILGKGFIGQRLHQAWGCAVSTRKIFNYDDVIAIIKKIKPSVIVNCIGETGSSSTDDCEQSIQSTMHANTIIPILLAEACFRHRIKLVHISSGCIYHYNHRKDRPINEKRMPSFFDLFYSRTKIYAEGGLHALLGQSDILMVRIRIPLDNRPHPKNLLTKLLSYKKVINVPNSVTYLPDFILALEHLIKIDAKGIYNVVNKGGLKYPKLMNTYKKHTPDFKYELVDYKKLGLLRTNLLLSTLKLERSGFRVRKINDVLDECAREYLEHDN
jgi:3,5-epimerase/4-reductase